MKKIVEQTKNRSLFQSQWVARKICKAEKKKTKGADPAMHSKSN